MALYPCANPTCKNIKTRRKYLFCDICRRAGINIRTHPSVVRVSSDMDSPPPVPPTPDEQLASDRVRNLADTKYKLLEGKYRSALTTIDRLEGELGIVTAMREGVAPFAIKAQKGTGTSEATPVLVASDWHFEEEVDPRTVSGLNAYNLDIAHKRATEFFTHGLRLVKLLNQDVAISDVVVALLGDFISNDIHEEVAEVTDASPTNAIVLVLNELISGIEYFLENSSYTFTFVCKSGNHGRTTKTTRFATENGHSLEYLMYLHLAAHFRTEPRVRFIIEDGIHTYLPVYDRTVRFHHGHAIRYAGGVGGITIPVNKAIAQWDKGRTADIDVFGHFHQSAQHRKWVCNGPMIGYNAFAMSIKADYEPPSQTLFLLDKRRGRTAVWPILFTV